MSNFFRKLVRIPWSHCLTKNQDDSGSHVEQRNNHSNIRLRKLADIYHPILHSRIYRCKNRRQNNRHFLDKANGNRAYRFRIQEVRHPHKYICLVQYKCLRSNRYYIESRNFRFRYCENNLRNNLWSSPIDYSKF